MCRVAAVYSRGLVSLNSLMLNLVHRYTWTNTHTNVLLYVNLNVFTFDMLKSDASANQCSFTPLFSRTLSIPYYSICMVVYFGLLF